MLLEGFEIAPQHLKVVIADVGLLSLWRLPNLRRFCYVVFARLVDALESTTISGNLFVKKHDVSIGNVLGASLRIQHLHLKGCDSPILIISLITDLLCKLLDLVQQVIELLSLVSVAAIAVLLRHLKRLFQVDIQLVKLKVLELFEPLVKINPLLVVLNQQLNLP